MIAMTPLITSVSLDSTPELLTDELPDTPTRHLALFDLDLTLIDVNSATLWIRAERRLGYISLRQLIHAAWILTRYRLGASSLDAALLSAIETLRGQNEAEFQARVAAFYEREVKHRVRPGALQALEAHHARGDHCYLMTSASSYLSELFVSALGVEGALAQRFEVEAGRFTGRPDGGLCFGAGKLKRARALAAQLNIPLSACSFYTDSFSDVPLLEAVGSPHVVHPDPRLARHAARRGWVTHVWS